MPTFINKSSTPTITHTTGLTLSNIDLLKRISSLEQALPNIKLNYDLE